MPGLLLPAGQQWVISGAAGGLAGTQAASVPAHPQCNAPPAGPPAALAHPGAVAGGGGTLLQALPHCGPRATPGAPRRQAKDLGMGSAHGLLGWGKRWSCLCCQAGGRLSPSTCCNPTAAWLRGRLRASAKVTGASEGANPATGSPGPRPLRPEQTDPCPRQPCSPHAQCDFRLGQDAPPRPASPRPLTSAQAWHAWLLRAVALLGEG